MGRTNPTAAARPPSPSYRLAPQSRVRLHEWRVVRERGPPLLVSPQARRFLELDEDGVAAVQALADAPGLAAAEALLRRRTGQAYDLVAFAKELIARGFVASVDDIPIPGRAPPPPTLLDRVPPERLRWLQSRLVPLAVLLAAGAWVWAMRQDPTLAPSFSHLHAGSRPLWSLLSVVAGMVSVALLHEMGHYFMARSYGIPARLGITRRLYFLVLITDVTAAWALPRAARLRIFLAGVSVNVVLASGLTFLLTRALGTPAEPWLRLAILLNVFPLVFQLLFFARTDLYHVLALATGDRNLAADAKAYLRLRARRAWLRLRRAPWQRCRRCEARAYGAEEHCLKCGEPRRLKGAPSPIAMEAGPRLLAFGAVFLLGQLLIWAWAALVGLRFQFTIIRIGLAMTGAARGPLDVVEGVLIMLIAALQITVLGWFVFGGLGRVGMQTWRGGARA